MVVSRHPSSSGAASGAVAVAWTEAAVPAEADWRPCIALGEDHWRLDGPLAHDPTAIAIRLRLHPEGEWSPASAERRSLDVAGLPPIASPRYPAILRTSARACGSDEPVAPRTTVSPGRHPASRSRRSSAPELSSVHTRTTKARNITAQARVTRTAPTVPVHGL